MKKIFLGTNEYHEPCMFFKSYPKYDIGEIVKIEKGEEETYLKIVKGKKINDFTYSECRNCFFSKEYPDVDCTKLCITKSDVLYYFEKIDKYEYLFGNLE